MRGPVQMAARRPRWGGSPRLRLLSRPPEPGVAFTKPRTLTTMADTPGKSRPQADKERSKQMSRPVTANQPGRGNGRPGAKANSGNSGPRRSDARGPQRGPRSSDPRRPGTRGTTARRSSRRSPTALLTWGTAAIVVVIVVVLVVVKVTGGSGLSSGEAWAPITPAVASELSSVPTSVFNAVGVTSSVAPLASPVVTSGQKPLTYQDSSGRTLPGVFFYGAEYCPHCAAQRWAITVALDRFGSFQRLGNMTSSSSDEPSNIPTVTFLKAKYTSPYIVFKSLEAYSNQPNSAGTAYATLQTPTLAEERLLTTYDSTKYFPSIQAGYLAFPFVDIGNKILTEETFPASYLQGYTRDQIAGGLKDPKNPITQGIIASSNIISASICSIDGQQPTTVCTSKGVTAAAKALKLS